MEVHHVDVAREIGAELRVEHRLDRRERQRAGRLAVAVDLRERTA